MANSFLTPQQITREALRVLHNKLTFIGNINRQYDDSFSKSGAKIGDTLRIRLPNQYTVRTGKTLSAPSIFESPDPASLARHLSDSGLGNMRPSRQRNRAAANWNDDGPGSTRNSSWSRCLAIVAPRPNHIGSPEASATVGVPRCSSNCASMPSSVGVRQTVRFGTRPRSRAGPRMVSATGNAGSGPSPAPMTVSQGVMMSTRGED